MGVTKTRMAAKRLCDGGKIHLHQKPVKPSQEIQGGETLDVVLPQKEIRLKILEIPSGKSVAKSDRPQYFALESVREL
jgi:ribosomal 50S subunit-recycling heat shock protein